MEKDTGKEDNQVRTVSIHSFIAARAKELKALSARASGSTDPSKIPFKHIPKHLRRRAVSHNVKRLPFRFRPKQETAAHGSRGDPLSFISDKKKIKSRKSRRRKSNLLSLYNNRQRVVKWLETHIWHAKRFHVENKWNYKIPMAPCNKGKRPLYRSVKSYATMQDVSYYYSFELCGPLESLSKGLNSMLPEASNPKRIDEDLYVSGEREGSFHVYHPGTYPFGYIGEMKAIWLKSAPSTIKGDGIASIWVSVHPAIKDEFVKECELVFQLERGSFLEDVDMDKPHDILADGKGGDKKPSIDETKLVPKKTEFWGTYWLNDKAKLRMDLIQGQLNRIRLCGPESFGVLKQILQPSSARILEGHGSSESKTWLEDFPIAKLVKNKSWSHSEMLEAQSLVWELVSDFADLPFGAVIPLIVRDPRVFLPQTRSKILNASKTEDIDEEDEDEEQVMSTDVVDKMVVLPVGDSTVVKSAVPVKDETFSNLFSSFVRHTCSPLEDMKFRQEFVKHRMSDQEFCRRRAGLLIPGSEIDLGTEENQIPVILIHRHPSSNAKNLTDSGFDLIVPAAWAMSFWVALAYRCTRAAGLRDSINVAYQARSLHSSLFMPPDSTAGQQEELVQTEANRQKYFSYPPAKRQNLVKLNCVSPFGNNWSGILDFCRGSEKMDTEDIIRSRFYVLRDTSLLKLLAANLQTRFWRKLIENLNTIPNLDDCLVGCRVEIDGRGTVEDRAVICLPTEEDLLLLAERNNPLLIGPKTHEEPPRKEVDTEKQRKLLREKHIKIMEFLRRRRKSIREHFKNRITSTSSRKDLLFFKADCDAQLKDYDSKLLSKLYNEKINNFWLIPKEEFSEGLNSATRSPIGFTIYGGNDYSRGRCSALAYITARGLLNLAELGLSNKKLGKFVLVRNWTNTYVYAHAKLEILLL